MKLSTYFSGVGLRWLIDHHEVVHNTREEDDLLFSTTESWIVRVSSTPPPNCEALETRVEAFNRQEIAYDGSLKCISSVVDED